MSDRRRDDPDDSVDQQRDKAKPQRGNLHPALIPAQKRPGRRHAKPHATATSYGLLLLSGVKIRRLMLRGSWVQHRGDPPRVSSILGELHAPAQCERGLDRAVSAEDGRGRAVFYIAAAA